MTTDSTSTPPAVDLNASIEEARDLLELLSTDGHTADELAQWAGLLVERFSLGKKVLICGNGGSACDAMHFAEELTGRFRQDRAPLPAIACSDPGHITCTANDYGYDAVFARWVNALGQPGDVLILLSTSGNSANITAALEAAQERGLIVLALLGRGGGQLAGRADREILVPGKTADRIQELHMLLLHTLVEGIEQALLTSPAPTRTQS